MNKHFSPLLAVCVLLAATPLSLAVEEETIIIRAARMLDVVEGQMIENPVIVVQGNRIMDVNPETMPQGGELYDLGDVTLLPGLIDCHTHLTMQLSPTSFTDSIRLGPADAAIRGTVYAHKTLLAGFTTVRDVGAGSFVDVALKRQIDAGTVPGPRMIVSGHAIGITGGHGDAGGLRPGLLEGDWRQGVADNPDEALKAARYQIKHGADTLKIMATAGVLSFEEAVGAQQLRQESMQAVVEEAERHGMIVAAHAHGSEGILAAVQAGVHSIEHCSMLTDDIMDAMLERGTYMVPTVFLTTLLDPDTLPEPLKSKAAFMLPLMRDNLKRAVERGIRIAFGTDAGVFPHGLNAGEFGMYVEAGMSELEALRTATVHAADLLGLEDRAAIASGKLADIIAVPGNPLEDISVMSRVSFVMKDGVVHKSR